MIVNDYDLIIIGAGPGGYVAAITAAQLGKRVALVEKRAVGGTCLHDGCIPTKTLLSSSNLLRQIRNAAYYGIRVGEVAADYATIHQRQTEVVAELARNVTQLVLNHGVELINGSARLRGTNTIAVTNSTEPVLLLNAPNIILATGSLPMIPPGWRVDGTQIHDSTSLLKLSHLPGSMAILGGGYIGCEFASLLASLGVKVTLIEAAPTLLAQETAEITSLLMSAQRSEGVEVYCSTNVTHHQLLPDRVVLTLMTQERDQEQTLEVEQVLLATGRRCNTQGLGLEETGISTDIRGAVKVDAHLRTSLPWIYAIGDMNGLSMLAHSASHQGAVAARHACGQRGAFHPEAIPAVIFTSPEIASVGYSIKTALEAGFDAQRVSFPFNALGSSHAVGETGGFGEMIVEKTTGRILGARVVGKYASTLIGEVTLAIAQELTTHELAETIHPHPTATELWHELSLQALGKPLHLPPAKKPKV